MKAITTTLYVCGGLMIAATIMGAIDYKSAQKKGIFDKLYKEENTGPMPPAVDKAIGIEDYSRGEINRAEEAPAVAVVKKKISTKETAKIAKKKKKKISYKSFSRAAIVEDFPLVDTTVQLK